MEVGVDWFRDSALDVDRSGGATGVSDSASDIAAAFCEVFVMVLVVFEVGVTSAPVVVVPFSAL